MAVSELLTAAARLPDGKAFEKIGNISETKYKEIGNHSMEKSNNGVLEKLDMIDDLTPAQLQRNAQEAIKESRIERISVEDKILNIPEGKVKVFSDFLQMKDELGLSANQIQEMKPPRARDIEKWYENGGSISIRVENGKPFWTYTDAVGRHAEYSEAGQITFPPEAKHPFIDDISIETFTGDRNKDKLLYNTKLEDEYGLTDIPDGYALHHDTENGVLQLIRTDYHEEFTHIGGHSMYKEAA